MQVMQKAPDNDSIIRSLILGVFLSITAIVDIAGLMWSWPRLPLSTETGFLTITLLAGYLGGCVHSLQYLTWAHSGPRSAVKQYFWYLISTPLAGAGIAIIFYVVIRGGLVNDARALNPFGVLAVSALAGMFARQAVRKLHDIAEALFDPEENDDKLSG